MNCWLSFGFHSIHQKFRHKVSTQSATNWFKQKKREKKLLAVQSESDRRVVNTNRRAREKKCSSFNVLIIMSEVSFDVSFFSSSRLWFRNHQPFHSTCKFIRIFMLFGSVIYDYLRVHQRFTSWPQPNYNKLVMKTWFFSLTLSIELQIRSARQ